MKIELNLDRFDELQLRVLEELIVSIREGLRAAGIVDEQVLYNSTANIAFSIAAIIDGSSIMELDNKPVIPYLAFAKEQNGNELVAAEGGSWMHEYVFSLVDEVFAKDD
ncbi:MAG: hypothetical protein DCF19_17240 [Pseudanabaena frigida]|uniref:Uncharacterized protein n=1 Tax=Pseudanabaena frigida TaxID=945775 RepID=A0A2W4W0Z5_9CYAN|nr:MAG: hypothetical protein DCF19_17240 [Pseudanabaena frigida]